MGNKQKSQGRKAPNVDDKTALKLWVRAGGRCSFPGCSEYLLRDNLTTDEIKHGHIAHIVAASENFLRGDDPLPLSERSNIENLILVCQKHHAVIDNPDYIDKYPKDLLLRFKQQHEALIYELTGCNPDRTSKVIRLKARIGGQSVAASYDQICEALFQQQKFPREATFVDIDLTQHTAGETKNFIAYGVEHIRSQVATVADKGVLSGEVEHLSVFAIGPIPLLVYLGSQLSNKIPTDLYQRHRDTENWVWKEEEGQVSYDQSLIQQGTNPSHVALILSLSGRIPLDQLPSEIDESFFIYEITLDGLTPNPMFLRTKRDLDQFKIIYHSFLSEIRNHHGSAETIHLFPAIPSPIAVTCGRELMPKVFPGLSIYDHDKAQGGFRLVIKVN